MTWIFFVTSGGRAHKVLLLISVGDGVCFRAPQVKLWDAVSARFVFAQALVIADGAGLASPF